MKTNIKKIASSAAIALSLSISSFTAMAETELTMYYPVAVGGKLTKYVDDIVDGFMKKNPDIKVNAIYAGNYNDARVKALAALKSGKPAQLSVMLSVDLLELIEQDSVIAVEDLLESDEDKKWLKSFYPSLMENATFDNKKWSIPFQRSTIVMYYNKEHFRKAGLDPETPPATWEELISAGKKLTKDDKSQWGIMIPSTGYPYWMFGALTKQNDQVLMTDGNKTFFDSQGAVDALQFWKDLGEKYQIMPKGTIEWGTLRQNFLDQKTSIMWHSTGNLSVVKNKASFDFGVAMLPAGKMRGTPTGGGNFYIFKNTTKDERQAALKLMKYMTSPKIAAEWSIKTGYMGVSPEAYETTELKEYVKTFPYAAIARDQLKYATAELATFQTGRVRKILDDAIQATLTGEKSPKKALEDAQKSAEKVLKAYRK